MPAPRNTPPPPETVAFVRRRYDANVPVAEILAESALTIGALYQCVVGRHDDGSGLPVPPLPRRTLIMRRRPPVRNLRAALVGRLWRAAETQVNEIEKRLKNDERAVDEREGDARVFAIAVRTMQDLSSLDADAATSAPQPTTAPASGDNDPVPRDIDEFRRRLAEKIDKLAAADAAEGAGRSET
jgi:hypothetical protein